MISVVMPSRNEDMLAETIRSMRLGGADEIVVIDDGSAPAVRLKPEPDVVVERVERSRGPSFCRNRGGMLAKGDIVIYSDAHVKVPENGLRRLAELAVSSGSIVCAGIKPMVSERNWTGLGGVMVDIGAGYDVKYRRKASSPAATGFIGSVYAGTRTCWEQIGWWPSTISWGYNEQALSLAVLYAGKMPVVADDVVCLHMFKKRFNYVVAMSSTRVNRLLVHWQLCEDFETAWLPLFEREFRSETAMFRKLLEQNRAEWEACRARFRACRKLTDGAVRDVIAAYDMVADGGFRANRAIDTAKDGPRPKGSVVLFAAFAPGRELCLEKWIRHVEAGGYPIDGRIFVLDNPRPDVENYARSCGALVYSRPPLPSTCSADICEHLAGHWNLVLPELSKYDYILSVEDDVFPEPGYLDKLLDIQRSQRGIGVVGAAVRARKDKHVMAYHLKSEDPWLADTRAPIPDHGVHSMGSVSLCCTLIRTKALDPEWRFTGRPNVTDGQPSGAKGHEFSLMKHVAARGWKVAVDFDLKCEHRVLAEQETFPRERTGLESFVRSKDCIKRRHCKACRESQMFRDSIRKAYDVPDDFDTRCPIGIRGGSRTMMEMAGSLAQAVGQAAGNVATGKAVIASPKVVEERWELCLKCSDWYDKDSKRCRQCGCYLQPKIALAFSKCDLGKWLPEQNSVRPKGGCSKCRKKQEGNQ